ncbi:Esterase 6 [Carabus blaptoides fortunei]
MSAGGASVHLHYMSPLTGGLFNRGFSMSGTALNPWVLQENPLEKAKKLAAILECDTEDIRTMINCLSHMPARIVAQAMEHFFGYLYNPFSPFGVVVEPRTAPNAYLTQHPYELLRSGDIQDLPWITSTVQSEGLYPGAEFVSDAKYLSEIDSRWTELAQYILDYNYTADCAQKSIVAEKVKEYYLKGDAISRDTFDKLVQLIGNRLFDADAAMAAQLQASTTTSDVYFYHFTYRGAHSKSEALSKCNENFGASHGDDAVYVLSSNINTTTTDLDIQMTDTLVDVWLSYAKNGIPLLNNKPWTGVSTTSGAPLNYVEIQSPSSYIEQSDADFGNSAFWHSLPLQENQNLFPNVKEEL